MFPLPTDVFALADASNNLIGLAGYLIAVVILTSNKVRRNSLHVSGLLGAATKPVAALAIVAVLLAPVFVATASYGELFGQVVICVVGLGGACYLWNILGPMRYWSTEKALVATFLLTVWAGGFVAFALVGVWYH